MNNKLVSIIVPVYGVEQYIALSIESICKQLYRPIEVILVDDETKDNSIEIAQSVFQEYPYITYQIVKEKNKGLPGARNEGAKHARGDYLCFIDSDDCIDSHHVERMVEVIERNDLQLCYSEFETTGENARLGRAQDNTKYEIITQRILMHDFLLRRRQIHCCAIMISKEIFDKFKFNENLQFGEDVEFMWRVYSHIDKIGHCFQKSYKYLVRKNSLMTSFSYEKDKVFIKEFRKGIDELIKEFPERKEMYNQVYYRNILGWMHQLARKTNYKQFETGVRLIHLDIMYKTLKDFEDKKVRILNTVIHINMKVFYWMLNHV